MIKNLNKVSVFAALMCSAVLAKAEGVPLITVPVADVAQMKTDYLAAATVLLSILLVGFGVKWVVGLFRKR